MSEALEQVQEARPRRFRPYPEYKESGVQWLWEIPAHWEVRRLKFLLNGPLQYGANEPAELIDPDLPRYIRITDIREDGRLREETFRSIPEDVAESYLLEEGDLLFARSGATVGKTFRYERGWGRAAYAGYLIRACLDREKCDSRFVQYFTASLSYWDWLHSSFIQATIQNVSAERYANLEVPVAQLIEQRVIIRFLDRETEKIDALVARKERLIELLQEKRTALISAVVTGKVQVRKDEGGGMKDEVVGSSFRLHPSSFPTKDSGVEWLGEIPAHWGVRRLKFLLSGPLQYGANEPAELIDPDFPRYIRITDVREDGKLREETFRSIPEHVAESYLLQEGDLLFARSGATVGKTFRYERSWGRAAYAGYLIRARLDSEECDSRFVQYFTTSLSYWDWLRSSFIQATIQNVSAERYASLEVPVPELTEQRAIIRFLDCETAKIDGLVAKVREAIERLKEFRTALISAAVTGKIDVREETT
jgi:type I restriction enzyme, S subunit